MEFYINHQPHRRNTGKTGKSLAEFTVELNNKWLSLNAVCLFWET
ncbi:MAG: hypothetical protein P1P88_15755 [Bacteroidales bacterium]|nr:hypothetical protein [Bacteroidales bacterium]